MDVAHSSPSLPTLPLTTRSSRSPDVSVVVGHGDLPPIDDMGSAPVEEPVRVGEPSGDDTLSMKDYRSVAESR